MERLKYRKRPASWWSRYFLMLITILLFSVFVAPLTRAADDTYSVSGDKITIKSDIFKDGTYTDGDNDPEIKCQSGDTRASVAINQDIKIRLRTARSSTRLLSLSRQQMETQPVARQELGQPRFQALQTAVKMKVLTRTMMSRVKLKVLAG